MQNNFSTKILDVNLIISFFYLNRKHTPKPKDKIDFTGCPYKNYDEKLFCLQLLQEDWVEYYSSRNEDVAWKIFYNQIISIADQMCPLKQYKVAQAKDPLITNEILEMIKDKDRLLRKAKRHKRAADWENAKLVRNNTNAIIHQAKNNCIRENLNEHHDDSKKIWQSIHTILPSSKATLNSKISIKDPNGNFMNNDKDIAKKINEHFTNIGPSLAANINEPWNAGQQVITTMSDTIVVDRLELLKLLKDLHTTKSSAIENLSSCLVKDSLVCLIDQFLVLVNLSFRTGKFPTDWKKGVIIPLPKDGDLSICNDYRPISLLPVLGKIIEKIYHSRLMSYIEDNHILTEKQGGFRKNNSTINTVTDFTREICSAENNHEISLTTFIDFSKAFDPVNLEILLAKVKLFGIKNNNFTWLENYLTDGETMYCSCWDYLRIYEDNVWSSTRIHTSTFVVLIICE